MKQTKLPDKVPKAVGYYWFRSSPIANWQIKQLDMMNNTLYHMQYSAPQSITKLLQDFPDCEFSTRIEEPK